MEKTKKVLRIIICMLGFNFYSCKNIPATNTDYEMIDYAESCIIKFNEGNIDNKTSEIKTEYAFNFWNDKKDGSGDYSFKAEEQVSPPYGFKNLTLYAIYRGTKSATPINLPTIEKEGYKFNGWAESEEGTKIFTNSYTPPIDKENVTLYAIWELTSDKRPINIFIHDGTSMRKAKSYIYDGKTWQEITMYIHDGKEYQ